ncbi:MAG: hypothetical protein R3A12_17260 [Ignavibacteria bacterium]
MVQDVTGDNLVDLSDLIITFNNASNFVVKKLLPDNLLILLKS